MRPKLEVLFLEDARKFLKDVGHKASLKILYNIDKAKILNDSTLLKKLTNSIWEFRTNYAGIQYRLLAFWDTAEKGEMLVITTNGFIKKESKIQQSEISKADQLRKLYLKEKNDPK